MWWTYLHLILAAKAGDTSLQACGRVRRDDDDERGRISKVRPRLYTRLDESYNFP